MTLRIAKDTDEVFRVEKHTRRTVLHPGVACVVTADVASVFTRVRVEDIPHQQSFLCTGAGDVDGQVDVGCGWVLLHTGK